MLHEDDTPQPSCRAWRDAGHTTDGIYTITPEAGGAAYEVYCDQTTDDGGWMLTLAYVQLTARDCLPFFPFKVS